MYGMKSSCGEDGKLIRVCCFFFLNLAANCE